ISVVTLALTIPLNRMVGRTFIPNEDMGEFTAHIDAPQGTSLDGTVEAGKQFVEELKGQEGVSQITLLAGADRVNHFHIFTYLTPQEERKVTQDQVVARTRKILSNHPGYAPSVTPRNPLGGGGGGGISFAIQASLLGPDMDKLYDYSQRLLAAAQQM